MINPSEFFEHYGQAAYSKNRELMIGLYHHEAELFDMWNSYHLQGIEKIGTMVDAWFTSLGNEQLEVEFGAIDIKQGEQIAFAYGFVHYRALDDEGKILRQMRNRMTVCLIKINSAWLVLHQHTSIPISSEDIKGVFE